MNLLISWSSLPPSLGLCQNFLMWVDFPEKMASIYFLHSHQIEYHCRTNEPCTQAMERKDEKKYMLPEHGVLLYLFFDMGHSRILPSCSFLSLRSQGKCLIPWGFSPDINKTFAQPHDSLYACYAFITSVALFPSEIILLTGCLYVMSVFPFLSPSLASMWAHREGEPCQS